MFDAAENVVRGIIEFQARQHGLFFLGNDTQYAGTDIDLIGGPDMPVCFFISQPVNPQQCTSGQDLAPVLDDETAIAPLDGMKRMPADPQIKLRTFAPFVIPAIAGYSSRNTHFSPQMALPQEADYR